MKILALDGGGVFGNVQAAILEGIDAYEKFDCFVGTSIGSATAAAIASGLRKEVGRPFFHHWMPKIFHRNPLRVYNPFISKYSDKELNRALRSVFHGMYYRDIKKPLFITAADVGTQSLKVFNAEDDGSWLLWEAVRAATAAETYFPSWKGLADGGVFANNPSMVAAAAVHRRLGVPYEEMEILSIGTGSRLTGGSRGPVTMIGWGIWLVDALLEGAADNMHDYFVRSLPLKQYRRVQFAGRPGWSIDSPDAMLESEDAWERDVKSVIKIVEEF